VSEVLLEMIQDYSSGREGVIFVILLATFPSSGRGHVFFSVLVDHEIAKCGVIMV
jgi:hypothetical protein